MTTGISEVFVDTNVLIYATNRFSPWHRAADEALRGARRQGIGLTLSPQILREYLAAGTRSRAAGAGLPLADILSNVRAFQRDFRLVDETGAVSTALQALLLQVSFAGSQVHDGNIVATMQVYGIGHLLTHNVGDFARFSGLITVLPLTAVHW